MGLYASRLARLSQNLSSIPASDRMMVIQKELGSIGVDGSKVSPTQQYQLAMKEIAHRQARIRLFMQPLVSIVILIASLYIILSSSFSPQDKHWAFGTAGTVIGFWLKG